MAEDFTQDTVLRFLQSCGGSVRNTELLQHFRAYLREHPERDRNRELFKKFINSVATVQQLDGASCVVLRKKYRGSVPGTGERGRAPPAEDRSRSRRSPAAGGPDKPPAPPEGVQQAEASGAVARKSVLPAAGIVLHNHNNNNVLSLKQQRGPASVTLLEAPGRRSEVKSPTFPAPVPVHGPTPGTTHVARQNGGPGYLEQHAVEVKPSSPQQRGVLLGESTLHPEATRRHHRHRQSYKAAVSYDEDDDGDDDDDDEEESSRISWGSAGGGAARPLNAPLGSTGRAIPASTPRIADPPATPPALQKVPQIYIQGAKEEVPKGVGSILGGPVNPSLSPEAQHCRPPSQNLSPQLHARSPTCNSGAQLSSSYSSLLTLSASPTSRGSPGPTSGGSPGPISSGSPGPSSRGSPRPTSRGSPWNSSSEDLQARTGGLESSVKTREALQPAPRPGVKSALLQADRRAAAHFYHSSDNLYQEPAALVGRPWHHSTGNIQDDPEEGVSSDGSSYALNQKQQQQQQQQWEGRGSRRTSRVSSQLRSRMCRSMGADLDQLLQEEESRRGHEAARLSRLALISSSLSLGRHLSSSSLSSCQSLGELGDEGPQSRRSFPPDSFTSASSQAHREHTSKQSLVPLEPREHAWLVKGAAGAWPDIYALFREDPSLLNRQDFISGYTVLHWIAKHGDHRVLNTLWYGVEKAGLSLDVNARSASGHTPLHVAAMHGHKNMMRLLVGKFHADVSRRDNAGKKPWQYLKNSSRSSSSSSSASHEVWQLLGASPPSTSRRVGGAAAGDTKQQQQQQQQRRRRRHHFSSASSGERPTVVPGSRVKRSTSLAAFLKHKTMQRFQGHQSDSSL